MVLYSAQHQLRHLLYLLSVYLLKSYLPLSNQTPLSNPSATAQELQTIATNLNSLRQSQFFRFRTHLQELCVAVALWTRWRVDPLEEVVLEPSHEFSEQDSLLEAGFIDGLRVLERLLLQLAHAFLNALIDITERDHRQGLETKQKLFNDKKEKDNVWVTRIKKTVNNKANIQQWVHCHQQTTILIYYRISYSKTFTTLANYFVLFAY